MERNTNSELHDYLKSYTKLLLDNSSPNLKYGDTFTFGIAYQDKDGNWIHKTIDTVSKKELSNERD